jgi:N-acetylneuraminic acid mutarotase
MKTLCRVPVAATLVGAAFALSAVFSQVQGQAAPGAWSTAGETTTQRREVGTAEVGGKIYIMGGEALGREDSPLAQEFDPATGRWRDLAPMPKGASHIGMATMGGKIYVAGGFTANVHKNPVDQFAEYDIASNSWRTLAPLPSPLGSVGLAAVGGKLHVIGGRKPDTMTVPTHSVYDPATGKWSGAAPLPVARDHLGIVVVDGKIYVVGGRTNATVDNVALTDMYDPSTDKWQSMAAMPTKRSSGAIAYYRGLIVYHGGECKDAQKRTTFDEFEGFDPKVNSWRTLAKAPTGLHAQGGAVANGSFYMFGGTAGCGSDSPSNAVYAFKLP